MDRSILTAIKKEMEKGLFCACCSIIDSEGIRKIEGKQATFCFLITGKYIEKAKELSDVIKFINYLEIDHLDETDIDNYISSIFYVTKFILNQKKPAEILAMQHVLLAKFINKQLEEKPKRYYKSASDLMVNYLYKEHATHSMVNNFQLSHLICKMYARIDKDFMNVVSWTIQNGLKDSRADTLKYFQDIMDLLKLDENAAQIQVYNAFYPILLMDYTQMESCLDNLIACDTPRSHTINILTTFVNERRKMPLEKFKKYFTKAVFMKFYGLCKKLSDAALNEKYQCSCCTCHYDHDSYFKALSVYITLMYDALHANMVKSQEEWKCVMEAFSKCSDCLIELKQKAKCEKYVTWWKPYGVLNYNLIASYSKQQVDANMMDFIRAAIDRFFILDGGELKVDNAPGTVLSIYVSLLIRLKEYEKGMSLSAAGLYLYPEWLSRFGSLWLNGKCNLDDDCKGRTMRFVLERDENYIKSIISGFEAPKSALEIKVLLRNEIQVYTEQWPSKVPLCAAVKELFQYSNASVTSHTLLTIDFSVILAFEDASFLQILQKCIECLERNTDEDHFIYSFLTYLKYKNGLYASYIETGREMMNVAEPLEETKQQEVQYETIDPNDKCDIVPAYKNLQMDQFDKYYQSLRVIYQNLMKVERFDFVHGKCVKFLIEIAYTLQLHGFNEYALTVWYIALKCAKLVNAIEDILHTASFMMKKLDTQCEFFQKLLKECNKLVDKATDGTKCLFYTNLAFAYLECQEMEAFRGIYLEAFNHSTKLGDLNTFSYKNTYLIQCYFVLLQMQLLHIPCAISIKDHDRYVLVQPHNAFKGLLAYFKATELPITSFYQLVFYSLGDSIVANYCWWHMPREIRCYGTEVLKLAQAYEMPLQTLRLLAYLTYADIINCKFDAADVKLQGMSYLLALNQSDVDDITDGVDNLVMNDYNAIGSPNLYSERLRLPKFVDHAKKCDCIYCANYELREIVMNFYRLNGLLCECRSLVDNARNWYDLSLEFYANVKKYRLPFKHPINYAYYHEEYCKLIVAYAKYYMRADLFAQATKLIDMLIGKFIECEKPRIRNTYLKDCIYSLKMTLGMQRLHYFDEAERVSLDVKAAEATSQAKTPESKVSNVMVPMKSPMIQITDCDIAKKIIPFSLGDATTPANSFKTPSVIRRPTRAARDENASTPLVVPEALSVRTKTLTAKLRSGRREVKSEAKPTDIKKNLLSDLSADVRVTRSSRRKIDLNDKKLLKTPKNDKK